MRDVIDQDTLDIGRASRVEPALRGDDHNVAILMRYDSHLSSPSASV
jgi:hypothetical protein